MKKYGTKPYVLGVSVTPRTIDAVLLQEGPEGPEVLRCFRRQRNASFVTADLADPQLPAEDGLGGDFTIQFGEGGSDGTDLFMGSEFDGLQGGVEGYEMEGADAQRAPETCELELADILKECEAAGYPDPPVAFCNTTAEITTVELRVPPRKNDKKGEGKDRPAKPGAGTDGGALRELLALKLEQTYSPDEVAFLPMTPTEEGTPRFLALIRKTPDVVVETLQAIRTAKASLPPIRLLDNEVHAYLGVARATALLRANAAAAEGAFEEEIGHTAEAKRTLVVRAGVEDTLVMFVEDGTLQHYENLRSITTYDAPETICSRVLLLQDEYATGEVQTVLVLGEDREGSLIDSFSLFFPEAHVASLTAFLPTRDDEDTPLPRTRVLATTAALRMLNDDLYQSVFEQVNLLPERLLRRQFRMPIPWPALAMLVVLFCTVLFFVYRYFGIEHQMAEVEQRLQVQNVAELEADAKALQARIDSVKAATAGYLRALDVLDSLLVGSDQWSRALEKMSRETAAIAGGIWVESWRLDGADLELEGNATDRDHVVMLADRLDASINSLSFSEIREWPVYSFRMTFPLERGLPEAARYLREHVVIDGILSDAAAATAEDPAPEDDAPTGTPSRERPPNRLVSL